MTFQKQYYYLIKYLPTHQTSSNLKFSLTFRATKLQYMQKLQLINWRNLFLISKEGQNIIVQRE